MEKPLKLRLNAAHAAAWRSAWHAHNSAPSGLRREAAPVHIPGDIFSLRDLRAAMRFVHLQAGAPSSRELERTAPPGHLPHTALDRVLDTRAGPRLPSLELLDAFLAGCNVPARNRAGWERARQRLVSADPTLSARALARETRSALDLDWHERGAEAARLQEQQDEIQRQIGHLVDQDSYDEQLDRERERERDRTFDEQVAYYDSLSAEELDQIQRDAESGARQAGRQLLADMAKRVHPADRAQAVQAVPELRRSRP